MNIYIINLLHDKEKMDFLNNHLSSLSLQYEFVRALDGKRDQLDVSYSGHVCDSISRKITPGELGTIASHRKVLELFLRTKDLYAIILEDDVLLDSNIKVILDSVNFLPDELDVLLLGHHEKWSRDVPVEENFWYHHPITNELSIKKPARLAMGAYGYMVSRKGAQKVLELTENIDRPYDWYTGDSELQNLFICVPPLVHVNSDFNALSNLATERDKLEIESKQLVSKDEFGFYFQFLKKIKKNIKKLLIKIERFKPPRRY